MPRDSSGNYTLVPGTLVNSGDTILVSQHNPAMQDIAAALTGGLARSGAGGMLGNLPMNNNRITGMAAGIDPNDAVTMAQIAEDIVPGIPSIPIGAVLDYWGTTPPDGYLLCYGQAVSRATYAALFAVIGTAAGAGDGSTTFNLPDYRGLVSAGKADMGGSYSGWLSGFASTLLGAIFGSQSHILTTAQIPPHTHTVNDPGHSHDYTMVTGGGSFVDTGTGARSQSSTTSSATTGITLNNTGGSEGHPNVQPTIVCNKIMRAV